MKSLKKNSIILFIITAIVLVCVLKDDFQSIISTLAGANLFWIFIALLCFFIAIGFEARAYQLIIKGYQSNYTFKKSYIIKIFIHVLHFE